MYIYRLAVVMLKKNILYSQKAFIKIGSFRLSHLDLKVTQNVKTKSKTGERVMKIF